MPFLPTVYVSTTPPKQLELKGEDRNFEFYLDPHCVIGSVETVVLKKFCASVQVRSHGRVSATKGRIIMRESYGYQPGVTMIRDPDGTWRKVAAPDQLVYKVYYRRKARDSGEFVDADLSQALWFPAAAESMTVTRTLEAMQRGAAVGTGSSHPTNPGGPPLAAGFGTRSSILAKWGWAEH